MHTVEATLNRNAEHLYQQENRCHTEVAGVRIQHEQCKDELAAQAASATHRPAQAEARILQGSAQISNYQATLLQGSNRLNHNAGFLHQQESTFNAEVTKARARYQPCKHELACQAANATQRQAHAEARIRQESDQIASNAPAYQAELRQESNRYGEELHLARRSVVAEYEELLGRTVRLDQQTGHRKHVELGAERRKHQMLAAQESAEIHKHILN